MLKRKLTITFSLLFLNFISCTTKDKYAANSEEVEPQPVVISGKNVFNLSNGAVQCGYLPKTVTQYSLFCHAYVKSNASTERSVVKSKSMTSLIGDSTESLLLATEFAPGVSLNWSVPQVQAGLNPLTKQSCHVEANGLAYVCDLEFTETIVSIESLKIEIAAVAMDDTGSVVTQTATTDVRDETELADEVLVERSGGVFSEYLTFDDLKEEEVDTQDMQSEDKLNPTPTPTPTPTSTGLDPIVLITSENYSVAQTYCRKERRLDQGLYSWDVICRLKVPDAAGNLVQAVGFDSSVVVDGGTFQLNHGEMLESEIFGCDVDTSKAQLNCNLVFNSSRFTNTPYYTSGRFSFYISSGIAGGGGGGGSGGSGNDGNPSGIGDESNLYFSTYSQ